jgi:hypothetical protein
MNTLSIKKKSSPGAMASHRMSVGVSEDQLCDGIDYNGHSVDHCSTSVYLPGNRCSQEEYQSHSYCTSNTLDPPHQDGCDQVVRP